MSHQITFTGPVCALGELRSYCVGWIAQYEVWSVDKDAKRLAITQVKLDPDEILLQFQQSCLAEMQTRGGKLVQDAKILWKVQFPTAISPDVRTFAILRDIYILHPIKGDNSSASFERASLPLESVDPIKPFWKLWPDWAERVEGGQSPGTYIPHIQD